jgi:acetyl-CoA acetyltransferase
MDEFAARSHQRAAAAQAAGVFDREIIPLTGIAKEGEARVHKTVSADDGIRGSSTAESLAKIKPAFPQWAPANTTGGNASQITDGAAGVILMRRSMARKLNVRILGKYVSCAVSGLAPRIMGIGPTYAIPKVSASERCALAEAHICLCTAARADGHQQGPGRPVRDQRGCVACVPPVLLLLTSTQPLRRWACTASRSSRSPPTSST